MQVFVDILGQPPPNVGLSYGALFFGKYGVVRWDYGGYKDQFEYVNSQKFLTIARYPNPTGLDYWFAAGITAKVQIFPGPFKNVDSVVIAGQAVSMLGSLTALSAF